MQRSITMLQRGTRLAATGQPFARSTLTSQRCHRQYATNIQPPEYLDAGEKRVFGLLKEGLSPTKLEVQDISGGGSTYALDIVSEQFAGLTLLKQHRLVKKVLEEEMKGWHGIQLKTKAPE
ncbi:hypothetical protein AMS68_006621 [Peltaster fructicola]|uniref:Bola-like protein n=1 Tax=Peltaster fructicola TaxID=286661 RepID=A0A6H0Y268_9PEZI|nr:hypothetical protein AMS68_006621 [Peltaster fructicola]